MKIVLAPDSYKGSLTAQEACEAMAIGIKRVIPEARIIKVPMADGGEGTVQSLVDATGGRVQAQEVFGPLGDRVTARYGIIGDRTAVLEMAEASGLNLIPGQRRNPLLTSTYGTGELIRAALNRGCRNFIIGIGGSATNDGGAGMAQALGARLLDKNGEELPQGGGSLDRLCSIDIAGLDYRIKESRFTVACDVDNPLCGPEGASCVFGPQKGADPDMVRQLDRNLEHYSQVICRDLGKQVRDLPGAGAAGGLGAGMMAFLNAGLKPGVEIVIEAVGLEEKLAGADLVITGEGCCDAQTVRGKTPFGVLMAANKAKVPVIIIAGTVGRGAEELYSYGAVGLFPIVDRPMTLERAVQEAGSLLTNASERIIRVIKYYLK